jgi:hypothetical protein
VEKIGMSQARSKLEKVKLWLDVFALGVGILVGIGGSVVGLIAWTESRNANRLNVDTQQDADETKLNEFLLDKDNSALSGLWTIFPNETNALVIAQKQILLLISTNESDFADLCGQTNLVPLNIRELNNYIWDGSHFYDDRRVHLRKAYNLMEWIYDQIEYSFDANQRGQMNKGDFSGWVGYVDGLCTHPLFLAALQDDHDNGYPSKEYCAFVRQRILAKSQGREILSGLYSNVLDSAWVNSIGSTIKP